MEGGIVIPKWTGAQYQPLDVQPFHKDFDASVYAAEHVFLRYENVVEDQFSSI